LFLLRWRSLGHFYRFQFLNSDNIRRSLCQYSASQYHPLQRSQFHWSWSSNWHGQSQSSPASQYNCKLCLCWWMVL
jgi:hypothetical protein